MRIDRNHARIAFFLVWWTFSFAAVTGAQDPPKSLVASAKGEGTIKFGKEEFKIYAVVVKLFEDGKAEINLVTDISVFVSGNWSRASETDKIVDLKITGGSASGNLSGHGKMTLTDPSKSLARG